MIELSIVDILKEGKFGPVEIGDTKEEVISKFGKPDDFDSMGGTNIWKYAGVELHFWDKEEGDGILSLIWNDWFEFLRKENKGKRVNLSLNFLEQEDLRFKTVEKFLLDLGIKFELYRSTITNSYYMHFESCAGFHLEEYDDEEKPLNESEIIAIQVGSYFDKSLEKVT